jgi:predicted tellurium resistance membrane protein TerC
MIELMDLTFSIDNVFAAVAFTDNIYIVCTGVFIGILAMRVVAGYFVRLMERFPFLDSIAFLVIGILGLKLCLGFYCSAFGQESSVCKLLEGEKADLVFSITTVTLFILPIITSVLFGYPKRKVTKHLN